MLATQIKLDKEKEKKLFLHILYIIYTKTSHIFFFSFETTRTLLILMHMFIG